MYDFVSASTESRTGPGIGVMLMTALTYHPLMRLRAITFALLFALSARADQPDENRAKATLAQMNQIAAAIEAYMTDVDAAPADTSVLSPIYIKSVPTRDGWETSFRYVKTGNQSFQIISAGSDKKFDEKSWSVPARTSNLADDAVYAKTTDSGAFTRIWLGSSGRPLAMTDAESTAAVQPVVNAELEKMKGMTGEQSWSYLRTSGTARTMSALGVAIDAYRRKNGSYPAARSMAEIERALFPEFTSEVGKTDSWGTEFRYVPSSDGKIYTLISAGNDRTFDEKSWDKRGSLASADDDAVTRNGELIRVWDAQTRPGDSAETRQRKKLEPAARALLDRADALRKDNDYAGALDAYIDAVKADPAAADLESINAYAPARYAVADENAAKRQEEQQRTDKAAPRQIAALRQYLQLRPADWKATERLIFLVDLPEAESLLQPSFKSRPSDPELYAMRGTLRSKHGHHVAALEDYAKASELDPKNAERHYAIGVVSYEAVSKDKDLAESAKRDLIKRGLAAFDRAEALKADYFEALMYHSLLLRQQALVEKDPNVQKKLIADADALRARVVEIVKRRRR